MIGLQIVQARVKHSIHACNHPQRTIVLNVFFYTHRLYTIFRSLHSKKLHILGLRARMVCTNSLVIFFFSLSDNGTYHFWSRSLPCRLNRSMNCICKDTRHKCMDIRKIIVRYLFMRGCVPCVRVCLRVCVCARARKVGNICRAWW